MLRLFLCLLASLALIYATVSSATTVPNLFTPALDQERKVTLERLDTHLQLKDRRQTELAIIDYLTPLYDDASKQHNGFYSPLYRVLRKNHAAEAMLFLDQELDQNRHHFSDLNYYDFKRGIAFAIAATANYDQLYYRLLPVMEEIENYQSSDLQSDSIMLTLHYAYAQGLVRVGLYDKAAYHYQQALTFTNRWSELENRRPVVDLLIGELFINLHEPDKAFPYLRKAIINFPKERTDGRIYLRTLLAAAHLQLGQVDLAEEILDNVVFLKTMPRKDYLLYHYQIKTHLRLKQNDHANAKALIEQAKPIADQVNSLYYADVFQLTDLYVTFQQSPSLKLIADYDRLLEKLPSLENSYALFYLSLKKKMLQQLGENGQEKDLQQEIESIHSKLSEMTQKVIAQLPNR